MAEFGQEVLTNDEDQVAIQGELGFVPGEAGALAPGGAHGHYHNPLEECDVESSSQVRSYFPVNMKKFWNPPQGEAKRDNNPRERVVRSVLCVVRSCFSG